MNRSCPCERAGAALKHGYDALDVHTLDALEAEAAGKKGRRRGKTEAKRTVEGGKTTLKG